MSMWIVDIFYVVVMRADQCVALFKKPSVLPMKVALKDKCASYISKITGFGKIISFSNP